MDGKSKATVSEIDWTVTNISENEVAVTPYLMTDGLITVSDVRALSAFTLGVGSSTTVSIAADELPIQSQIGSGTVSLYFVLAPTDDPGRETAVHSRAYYFRHLKNYKKVKVFDESVLNGEYGGKTFEISADVDEANGVVGRTRGEDGIVHEVKAKDEEFEVASEGASMGRITGSGTEDVTIEEGGGASSTASVLMTPPPVSINWCFHWRSPLFVDNFGLIPSWPPQYLQASYAHATIKFKSSGVEKWSGYLNGSGCVTLTTESGTTFTATLSTHLYRAGRMLVANTKGSPNCSSAKAFSMDFTTGISSGTVDLKYSSNTSETRIAVISRQPLI